MKEVVKMGSDFARQVKEKNNWQIARGGKDKIDDLTRPVHNHNMVHENNKASQKVILKIIGSK